jgi:aldehyde dehydrogenase
VKITEDNIRSIVKQVVQRIPNEQLGRSPASAGLRRGGKGTGIRAQTSRSDGSSGVFETMADAVAAADSAFAQYRGASPQEKTKLISAMRQVGVANKEELSRMVFEETKMGRYAHKLIKHELAAVYTPGVEAIETKAWSGKNGLAIEEYAPFGVLGVITPSTHPSETVINNSIMMLAAGNSIVINGHPAAKRVTAHTVRLLNRALIAAGAPANLITCISEPTIESANQMFEAPQIKLLSITGGPAVVAAAMKTNKKVIAAGPGNPPVVVDSSADLHLAAESITRSASFDNNVLCVSEKEVFVVADVFEAFMAQLEESGNYRLSAEQVNQLRKKAFVGQGKDQVINRDYVGKNANVLAAAVGLELSDDVPMLFGETGADDPFVFEEQLMPFLPIVKVTDYQQGVEQAIQAERGYGHTASTFTADMAAATEFAKRMDCSIFVINGGTVQGLGGPSGESSVSYTIATPTGEAVTKPEHFARRRRIVTANAMRFV